MSCAFEISTSCKIRKAVVDYHLGGRVDHGDLLQDRGAVVRDQNLALAVLDHLVHAPGPQTGADHIGERCKFRNRFKSLHLAAAMLVRRISSAFWFLLNCMAFPLLP